MTDRSPWLVALATANLMFLVAAAWLVRGRLASIEDRLAEPPRTGASGRPATPPPARSGADRPAGKPEEEPTGLAAVEKKVQKLSDDLYDDYSEIMSDLHELKRVGKQTQAAVRRLSQGIASPGAPVGSWNLAPADKPPTPETLAAYRKDAEAWGVTATPGHVEVRGVLNMSPWTTMPIEYFVTRWPESGHETLLHVLGPMPLDESLTPDKLTGLVTAIYKGLVVAGFKQGEGSGYEPPASPNAPPKWIPPTGDVLHVGVRYALHGQVHVARATDWVIDPSTRSVLPEDAFRFTGSRRQEDFQTGDEQVSAEASGIVVSVYRDPNTLGEITVPSNVENRYQYNHVRIPKPAILLLPGKAGTVDAVRDRAHDGLRLLAIERDGKRLPIEKAPVLLAAREGADPLEAPFTRAADGWEITSPALAKGEWKVRVEVDGKPLETVGFQPLYVDLIFSSTPIKTEGDGALPVEPPELPEHMPTGTGSSKPR